MPRGTGQFHRPLGQFGSNFPDFLDYWGKEVARHLRLAKFAKNKREFAASVRCAQYAAKLAWHSAVVMEGRKEVSMSSEVSE